MGKNFRYILYTLAILICIIITQNASSAVIDTVYLQLKWKHQFQFAGYYAAIEKGFYEKAGLHVIILEAEEGIDSHTSLMEDRAQFGIASSDLAIIRSKGVPVVLLANIFQHSPWIFLTLENSGISNIHQLSGKKIMIEPHASELLAYLKSEAISLNDINFIPHSYSNAELLSGEIDAISAYITDELYIIKETGLKYLQFNPRSSGIDFYGDVLFTTENQIKNHPKRVKAFLDASLQGWKYALNNQEEIIDLIYTKYSERHTKEHLIFEAKKTMELILPNIIELGYINKGRWKRIAEIYSELNMMNDDIDLDKFIYERYPKQSLKGAYLTIIIVIIVLAIVLLFLIKYYRLVNRLKKESIEKMETERLLSQVEERYRILAENAPFSIIISKFDDGDILYINTQTSLQFEMTKDHALDKNISSLYANLDDRPALLELLEKHGFIQNYEIKAQTAGKKVFWASVSVSLIQFGEHKASFTGIIDISKQKELEHNLKCSNEIKDKFFSIIAHDLRGPIGNFQNLLDKLISDSNRFKNPDLRKKALTMLLESAKSTFILLENLLVWSKNQRGLMEFNPEKIGIKKIIEEIKNIFILASEKKQISVNINIEKEVLVYADENMFKTIMRNLINNALKFTNQNGKIEIYSRSKDSLTKIYVKDNGVGIEKDKLDKLFSSNITGSYDSDNEGSTGLGLLLCKEFVEKHGGTIDVESEPQKGSIFMFTLPNNE